MPREVPRPEFRLPPVSTDASRYQGQLALALSMVLDTFQEAVRHAPGNFAEERLLGRGSESDLHRDVIDRLQQVHFIMQCAIARGYKGTR